MIKNGYINIYGVYTENYVSAEALACPKCRAMDTASVYRELEFEPPGVRIRCSKCGYVTPEIFAVYESDSDKAISDALEIWNNESVLSEIKEFNKSLLIEEAEKEEAEKDLL